MRNVIPFWLVIVFGCSSPSSMPDATPGDDAPVDAVPPAAPVTSNGTLRVEVASSLDGQLLATDANGDALTYRIVTAPTKGTIALDAATGAYTYTTTQLTATTDSFTFQVNDGTSDAAMEATVDVAIVPFNFTGTWPLNSVTINGAPCNATSFYSEHYDDQLSIGSRSFTCGGTSTSYTYQPMTILAGGTLRSQGRTVGTINDNEIAISFSQSVSGCGTVSTTFHLAKVPGGVTYDEAYVIPCASNSTIAATAAYQPTSLLRFFGGDGFFAPMRAGGASSTTMTVRNLGKLAATPMSPVVTGGAAFAGGAYPGTGATCGATIAGQSSCTVAVSGAAPGCNYSNVQIPYTASLVAYGLVFGCVAPALTNPTAIAVGGDFFCALHAGGVGCWGMNGSGQTTVPALSNPTKIAAGPDFACALHDGGVACWGSNQFGKATPPTNLGTVTELSAGWNQACVLSSTGLRCWGAVPALPALTSPSNLTMGGYHGCVIDAGVVKCWGNSNNGISTPPPMTAPSVVSAGANHSCAIDAGVVKCWGANTTGQTTVPALSNPTAVAAGETGTCALDDTGVHCWGANYNHETEVPGLMPPVIKLDLAARSCALDVGGMICW